ncbi:MULTISPECIES: tryptophan 2,3-dioxygenase family protein [Kitasatospora]|uniref:Tryptophan 2,3-dioxygenase n=1 Tax=Kitasatospora setae (strain ATCC 33774 / DSM 43861 / JCM 3304 / KCC A-0304 / NBRC 14216 / KM-6054) TaxID=452652 RepID=E4NAM7_KITSK|nr:MULTISPECIES: tryptophan 2,3-dioxygenase family protein [Kitasatospora]BAJ28258.1 putative tryptophan 2,3-dioxygenase [Kitasatospora setae KM-6054]
MTGQTHRPHLRFDPERNDTGATDTDAPTPYARYARLAELHSLQRPLSAEPSEYTFIVTTQVMELLFDLLHHEWSAARAALRADDLGTALAALRRGHHAQDVLVDSWGLLAAMTPGEFGAFRPVLGEASGFQSAAFLRLEFLLGNRSEGLLEMFRDSPAAYDELFAALRTPSLYAEALGVLARRGLAVPAVPVTARYRADPAVEAAWRAVYTDPALADLAELGERLLDTAERVTRWRQRHYASVKRTMGGKPGTGGSSGLSWLKHAAEQDVFPELWTVRDTL